MDASEKHTETGKWSSVLFLQTEHAIYLTLGAALALTAVLAIASAAASLWSAVGDWHGTEGIIVVVDRLLFVLMLVEILHTVRVSISSGVLTCEPFLVVGLIASIRRVLVITLESSRVTQDKSGSPEMEALFRTSMIELGVLGGLILVMVVAIFLLHQSGETASTAPKA